MKEYTNGINFAYSSYKWANSYMNVCVMDCVIITLYSDKLVCPGEKVRRGGRAAMMIVLL